MPLKVYELAKELSITNTEMVSTLAKMGMKVSASSDLDDASAQRIRVSLGKAEPKPAVSANGNGSAPKTTAAPAAVPSGDVVEVPENVSVKELAEKLGVGANEVQKALMQMGVLAALNQRLAPDAVNRIGQKMGRAIRVGASAPKPVAAPTAEPTPVIQTPTVSENGRNRNVVTLNGQPAVTINRPNPTGAVAVRGKATDLQPRPPVVTIMGHVDHGKTTLLDALRKTKIVAGEAGGITQHIGAYQIEHGGQRITFIDTPGHAAFSAMRARGTSVTDIVVLVVAADDSIMPQTEEAIQIAKDAGVPIMVAVNKIDLPDANPDKVLLDMTRYDIVPEAFGGTVITVNISAKTGQGLNDLLDTLLLISEAEVDPKADPSAPASGTVIEARLEKGRGAVCTVLVQQGTLRSGDAVVAGNQYGRIRTMTDDRGAKLTKAGPSTPVEIVGLGGVPDAGDAFAFAKDEKEARTIAEERAQVTRQEKIGDRNLVTLEELYRTLRQGAVKELNIVVKGDVQGSVQAVRENLKELGNDEVRVRILSSGVGPISENDVLLASTDKDEEDAKNALIVGFNVGTANSAVDKKAEAEHVTIKSYTIIYQLIDAVKESMLALLPPIYEENPLGQATVRQLFRLPGGKVIAGCYVDSGLLRRNAKVRVRRGRDILATGDIDTLKRIKDDAREVQSGYECGLTVRDFNNIEVGDILECYEMKQIPREL